MNRTEDRTGGDLREGYAEVGDVRLHYVEAGDGPLIVLLHGFPEFWFGWRLQIEPLAAAGFRVVAPDMRGYNLSSTFSPPPCQPRTADAAVDGHRRVAHCSARRLHRPLACPAAAHPRPPHPTSRMLAPLASLRRHGFCHTETCEVLSEVKGVSFQSAHRSRRSRPASLAIRSSSEGQTKRCEE
jgi:hypothetical protein